MGVRRRSSQRQQQRTAKTGWEANSSQAPTEATAPRANAQKDGPKLILSLAEVLAAIESLYADELKPFGRILRKRVSEQAMAASGALSSGEENMCEVDMTQLQATCEESDLFLVQPEEGGDWSVLIVGRAETFVDVYSSVDVYTSGMWGAAAVYFAALSGDEMYLPGGRYSCAQMLQARCLPFLQGKSLGQVCHIVQLAISQKKLLGYLNGSVVPYSSSQSMLKEQCALLKAQCGASLSVAGAAGAPGAEKGLDVATWETARQNLADILNNPAAKSSPEDVGMVPLSNVKRLFRSRFHTELSETRLGHSKLSELLQDERFSDICTVQLQGHGYIVVQVVPQESHTQAEPERVIDALASEPRRIKLWPPTDGYIGSLVQRTFIHAALPPPTPPPNARRRSASLPKDVGSEKAFSNGALPLPSPDQTEESESTIDSSRGAEHTQSYTSGWSSRPSLDDPVKILLLECSINTTEPMKVEAPLGTADPWDYEEDSVPRPRLQFCIGEPLALEEAGIVLEDGPLTQTPTSMYTRSSVPRWPSSLSPTLGATCEGAADSEPRRLLFCPNEPLALEEAGVFLEDPSGGIARPAPLTGKPTNVYSRSSWGSLASLSPSSFIRDGRVGSIALSQVQNTFIHSPLPPPTPLLAGGASRRSQSLPKNVGSGKNVLEATYQALGCSQIPRWQQEHTCGANDCGPSPSPYADYVPLDKLSSLVTLPPSPARAYHAGDCGPSPSPFTDYFRPDKLSFVSSEPLFVPPSPALTASPTYGNTHNGTRPSLLESLAWPQPPTAGAAWQTPASDANVISLASLLQTP